MRNTCNGNQWHLLTGTLYGCQINYLLVFPSTFFLLVRERRANAYMLLFCFCVCLVWNKLASLTEFNKIKFSNWFMRFLLVCYDLNEWLSSTRIAKEKDQNALLIPMRKILHSMKIFSKNVRIIYGAKILMHLNFTILLVRSYAPITVSGKQCFCDFQRLFK